MSAPTHISMNEHRRDVTCYLSLQSARIICLALLNTVLFASSFGFAIAPQTGQLPDYNSGYPQANSHTAPESNPSNEVRVDPFVKPASGNSSVISSNSPVLPHRSTGSPATTSSQSNNSSTNIPGNFQPSTEVTASTNSPLSLKPRSASSNSENDGAPKERASSFQSVVTMFTSLLVVLALFFGFMLMLKRANGGHTAELPKDVFQVLGTSRIAGRHPLFLLRLGHKLVLVHAGSGEVQTIAEVTDPAEVDRLCGSCEENQPNSLTQSFKQVLKNVTEGGGSKPKSFADNLRFRGKTKEDVEEVSPAMALLAKEKP